MSNFIPRVIDNITTETEYKDGSMIFDKSDKKIYFDFDSQHQEVKSGVEVPVIDITNLTVVASGKDPVYQSIYITLSTLEEQRAFFIDEKYTTIKIDASARYLELGLPAPYFWLKRNVEQSLLGYTGYQFSIDGAGFNYGHYLEDNYISMIEIGNAAVIFDDAKNQLYFTMQSINPTIMWSRIGNLELSKVTANPTEEATDTLSKIKVGPTTYNIGSGSSQVAIFDATINGSLEITEGPSFDEIDAAVKAGKDIVLRCTDGQEQSEFGGVYAKLMYNIGSFAYQFMTFIDEGSGWGAFSFSVQKYGEQTQWMTISHLINTEPTQANPSGTPIGVLTSIKINGGIYSVGGGSSIPGIQAGTGTNSLIFNDTANAKATGNYSSAFGKGAKDAIIVPSSVTVSSRQNFYIEFESSVEEDLPIILPGELLMLNSDTTIFTVDYIETPSGSNPPLYFIRVHVTNPATLPTVDNPTVYVLKGIASGEASHTEGTNCIATAKNAHAEGNGCVATNNSAHAEGTGSAAAGKYSHAEGLESKATENSAHAEGYMNLAAGEGAHAEGKYTVSNSVGSHAEGEQTVANNEASHAEGFNTKAYGESSHAEGRDTITYQKGQHAEGVNTICSNDPKDEGQHVAGWYNEPKSGARLTGMGNSTTGERRNIEELDWDGNLTIVGNIKAKNIPTPPTSAGTYTLKCTVDGLGNVTYTWEA